MKGWLLAAVGVTVGLALAGCGGGGKVSSASLDSRLPAGSSVPGFSLQRRLDWSDPVNLVGEGLALPQVTHPSAAVKEFTDAHFRGAAGEVLSNGSGLDATDIRVGVAQFKSPADANQVRDWMHSQDLREPCFSQCAFTTQTVTLAGVPSLRFAVQSAHVPRPPKIPPGAPPFRGGPANYLAEFTVGPYLYWIVLQGDQGAKSRFEAGVRGYYAQAQKAA
jgi:hypothetical protein